ncbi:hypothetical protein HPP92_000864 [Vanilla planifolia]|uniref:valine--tRNA ligase n=1 Tax=Vanilla planifolia TaxID=51239 RepID=A0A835S288_VANPL|nr:hypothetical protein HPP92_000864 [Vanilla planifolia]
MDLGVQTGSAGLASVLDLVCGLVGHTRRQGVGARSVGWGHWWESQGLFKPNFDRGIDPFVVPMPPPNVTGSLHMGHAMFVTLEDIMIRYFRMKGRPTLWLPGTDHAGIATQLVVEKNACI